MKMIRDVLVILASLALVIFVSDEMATKYKTDDNMISCSYDPVQELFIEVATDDVKESIEKQGFIFSANVIKENTITEDKKMTIGNKAIYTCNTTIEVLIKADPNNETNTSFIKAIANKGNDTFSTTFDRDYTVKENDSGTNYWVESKKITEYEISSLMKK